MTASIPPPKKGLAGAPATLRWYGIEAMLVLLMLILAGAGSA